MGQAQNGIAQMIMDQYDQTDQMYPAAIQLKEITTKEIEGNRQRLVKKKKSKKIKKLKLKLF